MKTKTYTVEADDETHALLASLFRTLQALGDWGCSRQVSIPFDGDGAATCRCSETKKL